MQSSLNKSASGRSGSTVRKNIRVPGESGMVSVHIGPGFVYDFPSEVGIVQAQRCGKTIRVPGASGMVS